MENPFKKHLNNWFLQFASSNHMKATNMLVLEKTDHMANFYQDAAVLSVPLLKNEYLVSTQIVVIEVI